MPLIPELITSQNGFIYEVNNRGRKGALGIFNDMFSQDPKYLADAGNGFLMRQGFVVVWSGWDGELLPGWIVLRLYAPVASRVDKPITGLVRYETSVSYFTG